MEEAVDISVEHPLPEYSIDPVFKIVSIFFEVYTFEDLRAMIESELGAMGSSNALIYRYTGDAQTTYLSPITRI